MVRVFYAGHLRPFKHVGHHPQFEHIQHPPDGYEFVTEGNFQMRTAARVVNSTIDLLRSGLGHGSTSRHLLKFIRSRSLSAQVSVPSDVDLVFLPSTPFILGQAPWVIEIEDTTTLFAPFPRFRGKRINPRLLGLDGV